MSEEWKDTRGELEVEANENGIFEAVESAAEGLGLELEPSSDADKRMVGVFAAPVAYSSSPSEGSAAGGSATPTTGATSQSVSEASVDSGTNDNDEIKGALNGWASTHHEDVVASYGQFTTDPYAAVMPGGVQMISKDFLEKWQNSDDLQGILKTWKPKRNREVTLSNIQIVYLSDDIASATFQGREMGEGEIPVIANASAILIKKPNGIGTAWKVAAVSKFGDFE